MHRNGAIVTADLKDRDGRQFVLDLVAKADVLIEGFRPGAAERLGLGPEDCLAVNPRLVYVRMTGWGQSGPRAQSAGHDINYIGLTGALSAIGTPDGDPAVPLNLVGDFGGGSLFAVVGALAALWERERSGQGQVVDAAIVDGTSMLMQMLWGMFGVGTFSSTRGENFLDGSAPYYRTYRCADGRHVAVGALEPQFWRNFLTALHIDETLHPDRMDRSGWSHWNTLLEKAFAERSRDDWAAHFEGREACVTPVLTMDEAAADPHLRERGTLVERDGTVYSAPAPRFSRSTTAEPTPVEFLGTDHDRARSRWIGVSR
jgi:alpha-methylacyl-CoA racemase